VTEDLAERIHGRRARHVCSEFRNRHGAFSWYARNRPRIAVQIPASLLDGSLQRSRSGERFFCWEALNVRCRTQSHRTRLNRAPSYPNCVDSPARFRVYSPILSSHFSGFRKTTPKAREGVRQSSLRPPETPDSGCHPRSSHSVPMVQAFLLGKTLHH
jgi:hypothetical protein